MFQNIHLLLTGQYYKNKENEITLDSFEEGIKQALMDELEAAEFYRSMLFEIPIREAYYPLFIAMTDEMEHATRFSTIYGRLK